MIADRAAPLGQPNLQFEEFSFYSIPRQLDNRKRGRLAFLTQP